MPAREWIYLGYNPVNESGRISFPDLFRDREVIGWGEDDSVRVGFHRGIGHLIWDVGTITRDAKLEDIIEDSIIPQGNQAYSVQKQAYFNLPRSILTTVNEGNPEKFVINKFCHFVTTEKFEEHGICYILTREEAESSLNPEDWIYDEESLTELEKAVNEGKIDSSIHPEDLDIDTSDESTIRRRRSNMADERKVDQGLESQFGVGSSVNIFDGYEHVWARIEEIIGSGNIERAYLLDYSTRFAEGVIEKLGESGIETFILLKNPHSAIDNQQYSQITTGIKSRLKYYFEQGVNMNVRFYSLDGTVRARRIGNSHLFVSWYTREPSDPSQSTNKDSLLSNLNPVASQRIYGHRHPIIEFSSKNSGFRALDQWFREDVYSVIWKSAITPFELYEHEQELSEVSNEKLDIKSLKNSSFAELGRSQLQDLTIGELEDGVDSTRLRLPIAHWVDEHPSDRENRLNFLKSTSEPNYDTESLFSHET